MRSLRSRTLCCFLLVALGVALAAAPARATWGFQNRTIEAGVSLPHGYAGGPTTMPEIISAGVAVGDYDRDGFLDLYFVRGDDHANALFRNLGNGTFDEVAAAAGVAIAGEACVGPVFADYDGDGWLDLFVGGVEGTAPRVFRNLGNGTFDDVTVATELALGGDTFSASFGDPDRDGDLDIFCTHWGTAHGPGHLWLNDGDGTFTSADLAVDLLPIGPGAQDFSFTGIFADIDDDLWPDLLVTSDFGTSQVFLNDQDGTFTNVTTAVISDENGMGACVGDYDNDADLDWFVSSIWDTTQSRGGQGSSGNRLYRNDGGGTFADVTDSGVREGYWGWGSTFADFDNDGWLDLYHVNGWPASIFVNDPSRMFVSDGDGTFTERANELAVADKGQGRGVVSFDYDRDGDIDLFLANNSGVPVLFRNDGGNANNWLTVKLEGVVPNREAIGARVYATLAGATQMREIRCGSNFVSQDPAEAHFGLANASSVDSLRVVWPDGDESLLTGVAANQLLTIAEVPTDAPRPEASRAATLRLLAARPNPLSEGTTIRFVLPHEERVTVKIVDAAGRVVSTPLAATELTAGERSVVWNGRARDGAPVAPGVYFYEVEAGAERASGKLTVVR